jgi:hypothetical protein
MTPHQLYEWAQSSIQNLNFDFVTENEYKEEEGLLPSRFATAETVHGTQHLCRLRKTYLTQKRILLLLTIQRTM